MRALMVPQRSLEWLKIVLAMRARTHTTKP